jgi:chromosome segregation ATPase
LTEEETKPEIGDKYKLTLLQIDKRFVDLELAVGELSEKIKAFDPQVIADLQEKIDSLDSLIMTESLGIMEFKKMIENLEKRFEEIPKEFALSPENLNKIASSVLPTLETSILPKIEARISEIEKKLTSISIKPLSSPELEQRLENISAEFKNLVAYTQSEIKNIKEKIGLFDQEIIQKIVSEVSDLRTEVSKEIRDIKEKIEGEKTTKSDIHLKFLSSRVNTLKENVDFLLNRKIEIDQKIQNLEKALAMLSRMAEETLPESVIENVENIRKELLTVNAKIDTMEKSIKNILENIGKIGETEKISQELEKIKGSAHLIPKEIDERLANLEKKLSLIESETREEKEKRYALERMPRQIFDKEISELTEKISALETRIDALEKIVEEFTKHKPVILE